MPLFGLFRKIFALAVCVPVLSWADDIPSKWPQTTALRQSSQPLYYWKTTPVGDTAQLLTLFCRSCQSVADEIRDQPLVAVLRDTLGDNNPENDRVTYLWLLSYSHVNFGQRLLSAVPFFYWRVGEGSKSVGAHDTAPSFDLTAPQHPVTSELARDLIQWTTFDPMTTPVRATTRAYRANQLDHDRLHLEEAISYLRVAPVSQDDSALTQTQLDTVIARLELRKRLLGGLVTETRAAEIGEKSGFEQERIRSRNWELLRQCADRTGLLFEPVDVAAATGQYAILWFPSQATAPPAGTSLHSIWKLLHLRNPWSDDRLKNWKGPVYTRALDDDGDLLPSGASGSHQIQVVPLAVYSLTYPKLPLLLVDFRDKLHVRWQEMTQRSVNEITAGIIGLSHFTNWYYFVAADLYDFVVDRRGAAMNQAARLDCYSQFRVALALDRTMDPALRKEMQRRVDSLAINPLEGSPAQELQAASARYERLQADVQDGKLAARVDNQRRSELARFEESKTARISQDLLHDATLGRYTHRAKDDPANLNTLNLFRCVESQLHFLDSLVADGTQPEVAYEWSRIQVSVSEVSGLVARLGSSEMRTHAVATLKRIQSLSQDETLKANCSLALIALESKGDVVPRWRTSAFMTLPSSISTVSSAANGLK